MTNRERLNAMDPVAYDSFMSALQVSPVQKYLDMERWLASEDPEFVFFGSPGRLLQAQVTEIPVVVVGQPAKGKARVIIDHGNGNYEVSDVSASDILYEGKEDAQDGNNARGADAADDGSTGREEKG